MLQAKALKAREKAVVDAAKDDEDEVQRKREERDAAKRKEEKARPASKNRSFYIVAHPTAPLLRMSGSHSYTH